MNNTEAQKYLRQSHIYLNVCLWVGIIGVLVFAFGMIILLFLMDSVDSMVLLLSLIIAAICGVAFLVCNSKATQLKRKALVAEGKYASVEDVIAHEKQIQEQKEAVESRQLEKREAEIKAAQHPQCPACHGFNTQRISTTKRVVSTSLVGLASSTIGKQYECLDCQHKW